MHHVPSIWSEAVRLEIEGVGQKSRCVAAMCIDYKHTRQVSLVVRVDHSLCAALVGAGDGVPRGGVREVNFNRVIGGTGAGITRKAGPGHF